MSNVSPQESFKTMEVALRQLTADCEELQAATEIVRQIPEGAQSDPFSDFILATASPLIHGCVSLQSLENITGIVV